MYLSTSSAYDYNMTLIVAIIKTGDCGYGVRIEGYGGKIILTFDPYCI